MDENARTLRVLDVLRALRAEAGLSFEAGRDGQVYLSERSVDFIARRLSTSRREFWVFVAWAVLERQVAGQVALVAN